MPATIRDEVERQLTFDRQWPDDRQRTMMARMRAVIGAQQALFAREEGAAPALRQSLVDLAAISELLAEDMELGEELEAA